MLYYVFLNPIHSFLTQLLLVAPLQQYCMGKWKDLIIVGVLVWVTAVQKAISCPTQPFSPVKGEEFGGETSHNVCVSFHVTVVLGFTKATIGCLGLQPQNHNFKRTQLHQVINLWITAGFTFLVPKSFPCYEIGPITICLTGNPIGCSEFGLGFAWLKYSLQLFLFSSLFPFPLTGENKDTNS